MDNLVITVARGFGSCGKRIAKQIADDLGIHCYENRILMLASQMSGLDEEVFAEVNEKLRSQNVFSAFLKGLPMQRSPKVEDRKFVSDEKLFEYQKQIIEQLADTESEIEHLESISNALDIALAESDLSQIKEELTEYGYIKKHYSGKKGAKAQTKSKPFHYVSSDGFDIFVGKNNFQNDELTFKQATGNDWWFHAKKMAGSHVVVKTPDGELPDRTFEEAGRLAAYYSKGRTAPKVEIDYIQKKHVKKPGGAKPGFVVYYTNYSLMAEPDITGIQEVPSGK